MHINHYSKLVVIFSIVLLLSGCMIGGEMKKEVTDASAVGAAEVIVVGEIELRPKFKKDEQKVEFKSWDVLNVADMHKGRGFLYFDKTPQLNEEYKIMINPKLDQTFFYAVSKKTPYIVGGSITAQLYHKNVGSQWVGGQLHPVIEQVHNEIVLPARFKFDIQPGDKAVYIGTIRYYRDEFNSVKKVRLYDNYKRAAAEFRKKFGSRIKLRKSIVKAVQ